MNLEMIKHGIVRVLVGLSMLIILLATKIDADHTQEVYYYLRIKFEGE